MIVSTYLAAVQAAESPTKADWIEAWATVAAAVGAFLAFGWQAWALDRERKARKSDVARLDRERRDTETAQARTVALHDPVYDRDPERDDLDRYSITVGNYGSDPITNIVGTLFYYPDRGHRTKVTGSWGSAPSRTVVPPGQGLPISWTLPTADFDDADVFGEEHTLEFFRAEIIFTDTRGKRWQLSSGDTVQPSRYFDENELDYMRKYGFRG